MMMMMMMVVVVVVVMVVMVMVMMDNHRAVLSHLVAAHLLASFFLRKGGDGEAERNDGRQGHSKLVHRFTPGEWLYGPRSLSVSK
jgi:hypothetical protein